MIQKIKNFLLIATAALTLGAPVLAPAMVSAETIRESLCKGTNYAAQGTDSTTCSTGSGETSLQKIAKQIVNLFSIIVGVVAVIMIIYGGFRYITSGGDSGKVGNAKNTLIYALIGLIVVALAQFIVHYVLTNVPTVS